MKLEKKRPIVVLLTLTAIFLIVAELISLFLTREVPNADFNLTYRKIETVDKLVLNGMLGHFFRFSVFGIINLLILPFLVRDILRYRKMEQWQKAFLFIYCAILFVVGVKGYFNPRYTLTLFPISVGYLLYSFWQYLSAKGLIAYIKIVPFILVFLAVYDFGRKIVSAEPYEVFTEEHLHSQAYSGERNGANIQLIVSKRTIFQGMVDAIFNSNLPEYKYNPEFYDRYPNLSQRKIYDYINDNHENGTRRLLTNNLPAVYQFSEAYAVFYWCGDDIVYDGDGQWHLFEGRTTDQVKQYLLDTMNVGLIYTYEPYNNYNKAFQQFLMQECELVEQTFNTYQLFRIRENDEE